MAAREQTIQEMATVAEEKLRQTEAKQVEMLYQMQAKFNVAKCEKKLTSGIDVEHIKNMFLRFVNSDDPGVKANALKVLFKAL